MPTTTPAPPLRLRGAARAAANRAVVEQTSGAAVSRPAAPESHPAPLPSRRSVHRRRAARVDPWTSASHALACVATLPARAAAVPVRAVARAEALPLVGVALVSCLVLTVTTPAQAAAATGAPGPVLSSAASGVTAVHGQDFTATGPGAVTTDRDGFVVGAGSMSITADPGVTLDLASSGGAAVRPVAGSIPTAGGFGSRWVRGCGACSTNHQGLDFAAPMGTPVLATLPGRVVAAGVSGGYGNQVLVQHANGIQSRYGHLSRIDVRVGQELAAGQQLGAVGSTGVSTGAHLHFEVIVSGRPVDPATWLQARGLL